jgi:hypothetical protein
MVVHDGESAGSDRLARLGRPDVGTDEARALGDILFMPSREIVEDDDFPPLPEICFGDVRSNEPGTSGNQDSSAHVLLCIQISPIVEG